MVRVSRILQEILQKIGALIQVIVVHVAADHVQLGRQLHLATFSKLAWYCRHVVILRGSFLRRYEFVGNRILVPRE